MLVLWRILCKCWSLRERKESEVYSPGLIFLPASGRTLQTGPCDARHILYVGMCLSMFLSVLICACAWWDPHMVFSKATLRTCSSFISVTATKYLNQKQCWRRKWCLISNSKTQSITEGSQSKNPRQEPDSRPACHFIQPHLWQGNLLL